MSRLVAASFCEAPPYIPPFLWFWGQRKVNWTQTHKRNYDSIFEGPWLVCLRWQITGKLPWLTRVNLWKHNGADGNDFCPQVVCFLLFHPVLSHMFVKAGLFVSANCCVTANTHSPAVWSLPQVSRGRFFHQLGSVWCRSAQVRWEEPSVWCRVPPAAQAPPAQLAVGATVNILDWKLVFGSGAFSRMFAAADC